MKRWMECPDGERIEIKDCLKKQGCRMQDRCATLPYLRLVAHDRGGDPVTPSSAGNGARLIYLQEAEDYAVSPAGFAWASFGIGTHGKLSIHKYTYNVMAEEPLSDGEMQGIADVLEEDEESLYEQYVLEDYKTSGSYKAAKILGFKGVDVPSLDADGNEQFYGAKAKKAGQLKTHKEIQETGINHAEMREYSLQLNRYRIFFESNGFLISRIRIQFIPRDGNTSISRNRGLMQNIYMVDVPFIPDVEVLEYYRELTEKVNHALETGKIPPRCNPWENWDGNRCEKWCNVAEACRAADEEGCS